MRQPNYLEIFTIIFIVSLLAANIVAVKLVQIGSFVIPAGTIIFPISYIVNDVLTEVYGLNAARRAIWLGFFANLFFVLVIYVAQILPSAPFWDGQQAYERILGFAPRLLLASFIAYLAGSFMNALVMTKMKTLTKERWLWSRTIGSTVIGEGIDSFTFMIIAFGGIVPTQEWVQSALTIWILKTLYEILATPVTYYVVNGIKRIEHHQLHHSV